MLKTWRTLGEILVFIYIRIQKKLLQVSVKGYCHNRITELASDSGSKQAKSKVSFFNVLLSELPPESATHI